jgi:YD repeat-containing protein
MIKKLLGILVMLVIMCISLHAQGGTTQYVYDDNGRLTAVIAPNGETSVYEYDAAGNIVSIIRQSYPFVSINSFGFTQEECISTEMIRVTILGTGFIPDTAQNTVTFNGMAATVESATQTEITTAIPQGFSTGNVRISNVNGFAEKQLDITSSGPSVGITPNGYPRTFNIVNAGQTLSLCFNGTANKNISLLLENVVFSSLLIKITAPSGSDVSSQTYSPTSGRIFIDSKLLSETGAYLIKLSSPVSQTGSLNFSLHEFEDLSVSITPDGSDTVLPIDKPGQNSNLTFNAVSGQKISLKLRSTGIAGLVVIILRPDGSIMLNNNVSSATFFDTMTLTVSGSYTITINPASYFTGSVTLNLYTVPSDISETASVGGDEVTVTTTTPGQNANVTFNGTANQSVSIKFTSVSLGGNVLIKHPAGDIISSIVLSSSVRTIENLLLSTTGTYIVTTEEVPYQTFKQEFDSVFRDFKHNGAPIAGSSDILKTQIAGTLYSVSYENFVLKVFRKGDVIAERKLPRVFYMHPVSSGVIIGKSPADDRILCRTHSRATTGLHYVFIADGNGDILFEKVIKASEDWDILPGNSGEIIIGGARTKIVISERR